MADVQHKNLTGSDLHEPKGVAAANAGEVYVADGAGSGAWVTKAVDNVVGNNYTTATTSTGTTKATSFTYTGASQTLSKAGALRIKFTLTGGIRSLSYYAHARIYRYRGGVASAIGTSRQLKIEGNTGASSTYIEDTSGWAVGDVVRIYGYLSEYNGLDLTSAAECQIKDFQIGVAII